MVASRLDFDLGFEFAVVVVAAGEVADDPLVRRVGRSLRLVLPVRCGVLAHLGADCGVDGWNGKGYADF